MTPDRTILLDPPASAAFAKREVDCVYSHPTLPQAEKRAVLTYLLVYIDELLEALPSEEERD